MNRGIDQARTTRTDSVITFGAFELDAAGGELRRRGVRIHLQEMPLKVLEILLQRPCELVRREEFFQRLWPDDASGVLDDNLNTAIRKLRTAIGDDARRPHFIETVPRRGYRFLARVDSGVPARPSEAGRKREDWQARMASGCKLAELFVGRHQEMEELDGALRDCIVNRRGWLAMIAGEAGIGKTRFAERLAEEATRRGATVLWGRSLEERGGPPYWPWVQVIRALIRASDDEVLAREAGPGAADIAGIVPELSDRLGVSAPEPLATAEEERYRLFDSVSGYLQRAAERTPLVLIFDNLHWAGRPSLLLMEFLAASLADSPILVVGTYRGTEVSRRHPLFDALGNLNRDSRFLRLQLRGIDSGEVAVFLEKSLGSQTPDGLAEAIHRETEGNPFFVSEVVRLLLAEGTLTQAASHDPLVAGQALVIDIPEGIREVIGKRLNHLSASCNRVLGQASVVGRQFDLQVLRLLLKDLVEPSLLEALEEAEAAGVIVEDLHKSERYRFHHALIRETLYDELSGARRVRLHARVGEALELLYQDESGPLLSQLAYHYAEAARSGDCAKAVEYNTRAGQQAEAQLAYEEAASFYQGALEALDLDRKGGENRKCRLLVAVARTMSKAGRVAEGLEFARRGAEIARRLDLVDDQVEACKSMDYVVANLGMGARQAISMLEEVLEVLGPEDSPRRAEMLSVLARACYSAGQMRRGEDLTRQGVEMARRVNDPKALTSAYRAGLYARYPPERVEQRLAMARDMLKLAQDLKDLELQRAAHDLCFYDVLEMGDMEQVDWHLSRSGELGQRIRQPFYIHNHLVYQAMRAIMEGQYDKGEALAVRALKGGQRLGRNSAEGLFSMQMFSIRRDQGRLHEVAGAVEAFVARRNTDAAWGPGLALIYCELDMADEAAGRFEELARNDFAAVSRDALWPTCLAYLSEVASFLEDWKRARRLREFLRPYDGRNLVSGASVAFLGPAAYYLGLLDRLLGEQDLARGHFDDAQAMNRRMAARPWLVRSQYRLAELLRETDSCEEIRARELLKSAAASARELGMAVLAQKIAAALGEPVDEQ